MILNDREIARLCASEPPLLKPFAGRQQGKPSYGLGSFGYDLRLGTKFLVPKARAPVFDVLRPAKDSFTEVEQETAFILDPGTFVLTEAVEHFTMPHDLYGIVDGKSTYARAGILVNVTAIEPGWRGVLTMEIANVGPMPVLLYPLQGIAQVAFFRGQRPERTYAEKEAGGVYQDQPGVSLPR